MKPYLLLGVFLITACSPYRKVTLTMTDKLASHWKDTPESTLVSTMGSYKSKAPQGEGYVIRYDYSYANVKPVEKARKSDFQVRAAFNTSTNTLTPRPNDGLTAPRNRDDSVIRFIDFYFDKSHKVQSVYAFGYPDSVYYVKRK